MLNCITTYLSVSPYLHESFDIVSSSFFFFSPSSFGGDTFGIDMRMKKYGGGPSGMRPSSKTFPFSSSFGGGGGGGRSSHDIWKSSPPPEKMKWKKKKMLWMIPSPPRVLAA